MRQILCLSFLIGWCCGVAQQPLIHSLEAEYVNAIFDPSQGLALKANHAWRQRGKRTLVSGVSLAGLLRPNSSPAVSGMTQEIFGSVRLQVHTGWQRTFGQRAKWVGHLEGFVGMRSYFVSGSLNQPSQGFERSFSVASYRGDVGIRFGMGYCLTDKIALQVTSNTSLIEVGNPLGFWTGLLFWGPDALSLLGIGVRYQLE